MMQFDKRFAEKQNDFGIIKSRHIRFSTASSPRCLFTVIQLYPVRVSGVVWGDACVPGFGCGLARESVGGVGFEVGL